MEITVNAGTNQIGSAVSLLGTGGGGTVWCNSGTYLEQGIMTGYGVAIKIASVSNDYRDVLILPSSLGTVGIPDSIAWIIARDSARTLSNISVHMDFSRVTGTAGVNSVMHAYSATEQGIIGRSVGCLYTASNIPSGYLIAAIVGDRLGHLDVFKNTFFGWKSDGSASAVYTRYNIASPTASAYDNIFGSCDFGLRANNISNTFNEGYNCFFGNTYNIRKATTTGTPAATSILSDALFVCDVPAVTLVSSPCRDAGTTIAGYVTSFTSSAPDMGCYEGEPHILIFTGTYSEGSSVGMVNFTNRLLSMGRISEVLVTDVDRPWVQQTAVTLDDSDNYFIGTFSRGNQWYDGTWSIWRQVGTTWAALMYGHVPSSGWSIDYGQQIVSLSVDSFLGKVAAKSMGYGSAVNSWGTLESGYDERPFYFRQGTITTVGTGGTVTLSHYGANAYPLEDNSRCWTETSEGTVNPENTPYAVLTSAGGWTESPQGTWTNQLVFLGGTKSWMVVGKTLVQTVPWPSISYTGISGDKEQFFDTAIAQLGLTWGTASKTKFMSDLAFIPLACSATYGNVVQETANSLGAAPIYYGGDRWVECLNDLFVSVGANWTVDGAGQIQARVKRTSAIETSAALLDFENAQADVTAAWLAKTSMGPSLINIYHDWNETEKEYSGTAQKVGSSATGDIIKLEARWQRDIGGQLLASRLMAWESIYGRVFALEYGTSYWDSLVPGKIVELLNIPANLAPTTIGTTGNYVIMARHYDHDKASMTVELRHAPVMAGIFRLDHSKLDGPDKLY